MERKRYNAPMLYEPKLQASCETLNTHKNAQFYMSLTISMFQKC